MEVHSTAWISIDFSASVTLRELFEPGGLEKFKQRVHAELQASLYPLRLILEPVRLGSQPDEKRLEASIPVLAIDGRWSIRIRSLPGLGLIDAIERLCAGEAVQTVIQWLRNHNRLGGYEHSRDWNLHGDLVGLSIRVQERVTANLAKIREEVLTKLSPSAKKRYEAIAASRGSSAGSTTDETVLEHMSARGILEFVYGCFKERLSVWLAMEGDSGLIICDGATSDSGLVLRLANHLALIDCQEDWLRFVGSQKCEADLAEQRRTAWDLDVTIDECLQFGESRAILARVFDQVLDQLADHQAGEKANGVPSAAAARDLSALISLAEDLRKVELNQDVWGLKNLGRDVPRGGWCALLAGDIDTVWSRSHFRVR
jgi:hypothetical protein